MSELEQDYIKQVTDGKVWVDHAELEQLRHQSAVYQKSCGDMAAELASLRSQLAAVQAERDGLKEERDSLQDAFNSTGGMWMPCVECGLGSLVRLGESRDAGPGELRKHYCGKCVATQLRAELDGMRTENGQSTAIAGDAAGDGGDIPASPGERDT